MQCVPSNLELIESVGEFLLEELLPVLTGAAAYNTRVAANILKILERSLSYEAELLREENFRLKGILKNDIDKSIVELNRDFAIGLRSGAIDWQSDIVKKHLFQSVLGRLSIDNPRYSTYKAMV